MARPSRQRGRRRRQQPGHLQPGDHGLGHLVLGDHPVECGTRYEGPFCLRDAAPGPPCLDTDVPLHARAANRARGRRVDVDTQWSDLGSQRPRQADDRHCRRGVCRAVDQWSFAADGGDVDDDSSTLMPASGATGPGTPALFTRIEEDHESVVDLRGPDASTRHTGDVEVSPSKLTGFRPRLGR